MLLHIRTISNSTPKAVRLELPDGEQKWIPKKAINMDVPYVTDIIEQTSIEEFILIIKSWFVEKATWMKDYEWRID